MKINEKIGTVEPIGYFKDGEVSEGLAFIRGAIEKYIHEEEYHEDLMNYIKQIANYDWNGQNNNNAIINNQYPKGNEDSH